MAIDQRCVQILQLCQVALDLRELHDRLVRIKGEHSDQKRFSVIRVLPEDVEPIRIEWPGAGNTGDGAGRIELASRERVSGGEAVFARALQEDIAVEPVNDLERGVEEGSLEAELHQHQQHRKPDAAAGAH